jgi:hypothetical protein
MAHEDRDLSFVNIAEKVAVTDAPGCDRGNENAA